ncbi:MAG: HlyD family efflux transporter periplasmic adaptor subunit [Planctomycetota bacterium]|nr:HlyD family efflux transporter periplasmic adaptor subunit [Planctomycetota bacterium]
MSLTMSSDPQIDPQSQRHDELNWAGVDALLREVSQLSQSTDTLQTFARHLTTRLLEGTFCKAACLWQLDVESGLVCAGESVSPEATRWSWSGLQRTRHELMDTVIREQNSRLISLPSENPTQIAHHEKSAPEWTLVSPILHQGVVLGLIEVLGSQPSHPTGENDPRIAILESVAALCTEYFRSRRLVQLEARLRYNSTLIEFATAIGKTLDLESTGIAIAEGLRPIVGCDRITVLERKGSDYHALAVSGAPGVERRANAIQRLEQHVQACAAAQFPTGPMSREGVQAEPVIAASLEAYLDASGSRAVLVVPLEILADSSGPDGENPSVGAVACDWFTNSPVGLSAGWRTLSELSATALRNSQRFHRIPWGAYWGRRSELPERSRRRRWILFAAIVAACALIPLDLEIPADGELQPVERRDVFATDDAVVEQLHVEHGDQVAAGDLLATLRSSRLDLERHRVLGELESTRQRLNALEAARLGSEEGSLRVDRLAPHLSGEEAGLRELVNSLELQSAMLQEESALLQVRAPLAGKVLTWDLSQRLLARPVQRGQALMTVGDPTGPWRLELQVPNRLIGHVPGTHDKNTTSPRVRFAQATEPSTWYWGNVEQVAAVVDSDRNGVPVVRVTAHLKPGTVVDPRPGEAVHARISCGWRPSELDSALVQIGRRD